MKPVWTQFGWAFPHTTMFGGAPAEDLPPVTFKTCTECAGLGVTAVIEYKPKRIYTNTCPVCGGQGEL